MAMSLSIASSDCAVHSRADVSAQYLRIGRGIQTKRRCGKWGLIAPSRQILWNPPLSKAPAQFRPHRSLYEGAIAGSDRQTFQDQQLDMQVNVHPLPRADSR